VTTATSPLKSNIFGAAIILIHLVLVQRMKKPPSTIISAPVTKSDACDARNTAAPAISDGSAKRPAGVRVIISSFTAAYFGSLRIQSVMSVVVQPGASELTWMLCGANSIARHRVSCSNPPLLTPYEG